ncbi:hypothetical protein D3C87_1897240 [compost metagenome]
MLPASIEAVAIASRSRMPSMSSAWQTSWMRRAARSGITPQCAWAQANAASTSNIRLMVPGPENKPMMSRSE